MLHPSPTAIEYIRNKFSDSWLDESAHSFDKKISKLLAALHHRPFNSMSAEYQSFLQKNISKIKTLQQNYPKVNLSQLITDFKSRLY
jgi:hypothetical protein